MSLTYRWDHKHPVLLTFCSTNLLLWTIQIYHNQKSLPMDHNTSLLFITWAMKNFQLHIYIKINYILHNTSCCCPYWGNIFNQSKCLTSVLYRPMYIFLLAFITRVKRVIQFANICISYHQNKRKNTGTTTLMGTSCC